MFLGEINQAAFTYAANGKKKKKSGVQIKLKQAEPSGNIILIPDFPGVFPIDYNNSFNVAKYSSFSIPLEPFINGNFILLPVQNENNHPTINRGEFVIGKLIVEKLTSKEEGSLYLFSTSTRGTVIARIQKVDEEAETFTLVFDNPDKGSVEITDKEIHQIFKIEGKLNAQINEVFKSLSSKIADLENAIDSLKNKLEVAK